MSTISHMQQELQLLEEHSNLRRLPRMVHDGRDVIVNGKRMLNLSSNDYLGLASDRALREEFLRTLTPDKLVHASLIDGIRLSAAKCIRYRHNDLAQLERLLKEHHSAFRQIIIVTESIFSMDGDQADLPALAELKRRYGNVLLYVDEAHAFGVRGRQGLGCAEESGCTGDIDFLVGTFGKAAASAGAYIVCRKVIREYLVNRMRTLIFTTGLPPVNIAWTLFVVRRLADMRERREHLAHISRSLREALQAQGYACPGASHIVPMIIGQSADTVLKAEALQRHGFYALPVRPPTVPEGTSRIRFSLTADIRQEEIEELKKRTENLK